MFHVAFSYSYKVNFFDNVLLLLIYERAPYRFYCIVTLSGL